MYKNYIICDICKKELPKNRKFFRRNIVNNHDVYHNTCRDCEDKLRNLDIWKEGLLLCNKCHIYKPVSAFSPNHSKNSERLYYGYCCKECTNVRQKKHEISLSDKDKLHRCLNLRLLGAKDRASRNNIQFSLTLAFLKELWDKQKGKCAISGINMTYNLREGRVPTNVSIDKIDHTKGYTMNNIQLVCMACNQMKNDLSEEELYNFCKAIVNKYESKNSKNTQLV